ncbi:N-acetylmuramic acid 6-phosphate etherase [Parvicella tangerina]|uniref:N-acetylmuramic acid 6-phosphate etherase n=1 Tax=Parvicella tangerina TaxID=2829795 RepID=A0A916NFN0_9FLAO|nr:N-acetylmuramic acid 6-phosphate etherase [Parvicella tangerina]CAG5078228.1 N-acetylmuramic acid 6-phosphate etherase [Parvicella tangerina]
MEKITESTSLYNDLDKMSTLELLTNINKEDQKVALAVEKIIPSIQNFVDELHPRMERGGRLFYLGAGTSGRLGVVDASECPPTYGVPHGWVVGLMAGGDGAMRKAVEFAEDSKEMGWKDLLEHEINSDDTVVGIAASGTTPYVLGALEKCNEKGILTGGITCNPGSPLDQVAQHPMVAVVGPEFVTGSTRMKSGTAQKLTLNMISTSVMIKLGRVKGNRMVDMQLSNNKLVDRGTKMVMDALNISYEEANQLLMDHGSVRAAIESKRH